MIYTVIADAERLSPEIFDYAKNSPVSQADGAIGSTYNIIPPEVVLHIDKAGSDAMRRERLCAYLTLCHTLKFLLGDRNIKIYWDEFGKPQLDLRDELVDGVAKSDGSQFSPDGQPCCGDACEAECPPVFVSLSHSGGIAAVTVCDEGAGCGVDVQEKIDEQRASRLESRFFCDLTESADPCQPCYLFLGLRGDGNGGFAEIPSIMLKRPSVNESFTAKWSLCEALMKCDGRGFGAVDCVGGLAESVRADTVEITYKGKSYTLSTAVKY